MQKIFKREGKKDGYPYDFCLLYLRSCMINMGVKMRTTFEGLQRGIYDVTLETARWLQKIQQNQY